MAFLGSLPTPLEYRNVLDHKLESEPDQGCLFRARNCLLYRKPPWQIQCKRGLFSSILANSQRQPRPRTRRHHRVVTEFKILGSLILIRKKAPLGLETQTLPRSACKSRSKHFKCRAQRLQQASQAPLSSSSPIQRPRSEAST